MKKTTEGASDGELLDRILVRDATALAARGDCPRGRGWRHVGVQTMRAYLQRDEAEVAG